MVEVTQLEEELISLVASVPAFNGAGFSVFDISDFDSKKTGQQLPLVGVAYDGIEPVQGNSVTPVAAVHAASLVVVQFIVVIAVQYSYTGQDDTKQKAFALLDQVRAVVLGYKGVNSRPWRFAGERPEADASGDGVVFYSQAWQTTLPILGNSNQT